LYHTDVLIPAAVTVDGSPLDRVRDDAEQWRHLILDYITDETFEHGHINHGLFRGEPIEECGIYHNPWPARVAYNDELFAY
jgi:hypothetical protein